MTDELAGWRTYTECRNSIQRARWGYLLANNQLTPEDAREILYYVEDIAGHHPVVSMCVEDVLEKAAYRWTNPSEEIEDLAHYACARVARKYEFDHMDTLWDWALELIEESAAEDGITLVEGEREVEEKTFIID
jgi:hypothetical protein